MNADSSASRLQKTDATSHAGQRRAYTPDEVPLEQDDIDLPAIDRHLMLGRGGRQGGDDDALASILEIIKSARNFDFHNYKKATVRRRIERRMTHRRCASLAQYSELIAREPSELDDLISTMLIKVSSFFRDQDHWHELKDRIVPQVLASKPAGEELRVWCAGCATGEETYSVAITIAEALGPAFSNYPAKVFGTDVDQRAIAVARRGVYQGDTLANVDEALRQRYFTSGPDGLTVDKAIRRMVVFGVNDLVCDAPISRLDLLLCRNVFIYLDTELQKRVLGRFHYALREAGILMLGKSELIPFAAKVFQPVDVQRRIYRKGRRGEQEQIRGNLGEMDPQLEVIGNFSRDVMRTLPMPVVATGLDGTVLLWNNEAARMWERSEAEVLGKKLVALGLPGLGGELLIEKTTLVRDGKSVRETSDGLIARPPAQPDVLLAVEVTSLRSDNGVAYGLLYLFRDVTVVRKVEAEVRKATAQAEIANGKVQRANEELRSANEELETLNEELQSTNEELQTTNEELQSTNEELQTTNEELQSTNAELDSTNSELALRTEEVNLNSLHTRTIIRSLSTAVVVLDPRGRISIWNQAAERLLRVPEAEALGQFIWSLRLPVFKGMHMARIRKALTQKLALRIDQIRYDRPGGGRGSGRAVAIPIHQNGGNLGAVLLFEPTSQSELDPEPPADDGKKQRPRPNQVKA